MNCSSLLDCPVSWSNSILYGFYGENCHFGRQWKTFDATMPGWEERWKNSECVCALLEYSAPSLF